MAEDPRKYPPVRATIVDDGWSSPTTSEPELPVPQAPNAVVTGVGSEPVAADAVASSLQPESLHHPQPLVVRAPLPSVAPERMWQASPSRVPPSPRSLPVGEALGQEVRCFGVTLRLGVLFLGVVGLAVFGTFMVGRALTRIPSAPVENQPLPGATQEPATTPPPPPPPPAESAAAALNALLSKPKSELSIDEAASLVDAGRAKEVLAAQALARDFLRNPELVNVAQPLKRFKQFAAAEPTASVTQLAMASLPGEVAADLLYEVWTSSAEKSSATTLAQLLVYGKDVLPKASPALRVALDLRAAESCEENHAILPRAIKVGDRRSLHLLALLQRKFGCGPKRKDDCYACLRIGSELSDALKAVRARRSPEL